MILRSVAEIGGLSGQGLTEIFGADLHDGAAQLEAMLAGLAVSTDGTTYGVSAREWTALVEDALEGERGRNFSGSREALLLAAG